MENRTGHKVSIKEIMQINHWKQIRFAQVAVLQLLFKEQDLASGCQDGITIRL